MHRAHRISLEGLHTVLDAACESNTRRTVRLHASAIRLPIDQRTDIKSQAVHATITCGGNAQFCGSAGRHCTVEPRKFHRVLPSPLFSTEVWPKNFVGSFPRQGCQIRHTLPDCF